MKLSVFVGSSSEGLKIAYALQQNLEHVSDVTVWPQGIFFPSNSTLDDLLKALDTFDFGVFVFSHDDVLTIRESHQAAVRDNVIFELGLFIGRLGRGRSFIVMPRDAGDLHIPTDLIGVAPLYFPLNRADGNLRAALGPASSQISEIIVRMSSSRSELTSKDDISTAWQYLLENATRSVRVLSGDSSWALRDAEILKKLVTKGVDVRVLCERPGRNDIVQANIRSLLAAGVTTRYYTSGTTCRGIVVDYSDDYRGFALRVEKSPKTATEHAEGVPAKPSLYRHRAYRHFPQDDSRHIDIMAMLFDSLYSVAIDCVELSPVDLTNAEIHDLLVAATIQQYGDIARSDIAERSFTVDELWSTCRYVKQNKLNGLRAIVTAYNDRGLEPFVPAACVSNTKASLLLPPLVEEHEGKFVIVDGMHRAFNHLIIDRSPEIQCITVSCRTGLPSRPIQFKDVAVVPTKRPRIVNFDQYDATQFRRIKNLDAVLEKWHLTNKVRLCER